MSRFGSITLNVMYPMTLCAGGGVCACATQPRTGWKVLSLQGNVNVRRQTG